MSLKNSLEVASSRSAASQRSTAEELLEDIAIAVAREGSCSSDLEAAPELGGG